MKISQKIAEMNDIELAKFLAAVDADLWGYCKANVTEEQIQINLAFLTQEEDVYD